MTVFTNVSDDVLEPGDPIRSVDILAIKNNTLFLFDASISFPIIDTQTFTTSGTWTRPATVNLLSDSIIALIIGGGGGGNANRNFVAASSNFPVAGGGGCSVGLAAANVSFLPSTCPVVVGAGAASVSINVNGSTSGNNGAFSEITDGNSGFARTSGGGGAPPPANLFSAVNTMGSAAGNTTVSPPFKDLLHRGKGGVRFGRDFIEPVNPLFGGGGTIQLANGVFDTNNTTPGPSFQIIDNFPIGAGGEGRETTGENGSIFGGAGGGGLGTSGTVTGGAGADGLVIVFTVRGFITTESFNDNNFQIP